MIVRIISVVEMVLITPRWLSVAGTWSVIEWKTTATIHSTQRNLTAKVTPIKFLSFRTPDIGRCQKSALRWLIRTSLYRIPSDALNIKSAVAFNKFARRNAHVLFKYRRECFVLIEP